MLPLESRLPCRLKRLSMNPACSGSNPLLRIDHEDANTCTCCFTGPDPELRRIGGGGVRARRRDLRRRRGRLGRSGRPRWRDRSRGRRRQPGRQSPHGLQRLRHHLLQRLESRVRPGSCRLRPGDHRHRPRSQGHQLLRCSDHAPLAGGDPRLPEHASGVSLGLGLVSLQRCGGKRVDELGGDDHRSLDDRTSTGMGRLRRGGSGHLRTDPAGRSNLQRCSGRCR